MIDVTTNKPLRVTMYGTVRPYIEDVPVSQLDDLRRLLDSHGLHYWVEENYLSFNGGPEVAFLGFGRETDPNAVQAILDSVR
jgi:hypothetical protein